MLTLQQTYSPLHATYFGNGRFVDVMGDDSGWRAIEVSPDGLAGVEIATGGSLEEVLAAAERALTC